MNMSYEQLVDLHDKHELRARVIEQKRDELRRRVRMECLDLPVGEIIISDQDVRLYMANEAVGHKFDIKDYL